MLVSLNMITCNKFVLSSKTLSKHYTIANQSDDCVSDSFRSAL